MLIKIDLEGVEWGGRGVMKDYFICLSSQQHHHRWGLGIQLITGLQWACLWGKRRGWVFNSGSPVLGLALIYNLSSLNQLASWTARIGRRIWELNEESIRG